METSINNKCKTFTSLKQSKKLAEILSPESADMYYSHEFVNSAGDYYKLNIALEGYFDDKELLGSDIPCWSLAALLDVLPKVVNNETLFIETSPTLWHIGYRNIYTARADNPVDACYEFILKLHELKML